MAVCNCIGDKTILKSFIGLAPGGKIKIIKSASLALGSPFR